MLTLANVSKSYGTRELFADVSLFVARTDRYRLVGPNGAGKSTLFNLILGEEAADTGTIEWERGADFGFLPQESAPIGECSCTRTSKSRGSWPKAARKLLSTARFTADRLWVSVSKALFVPLWLIAVLLLLRHRTVGRTIAARRPGGNRHEGGSGIPLMGVSAGRGGAAPPRNGRFRPGPQAGCR